MAGVDFGRYKRIVQLFWDPEPSNDSSSKASIWCLGKEYKLTQEGRKQQSPLVPISQASETASPHSENTAQPATPPDSKANSVDSSLAHDEAGIDEDGGWPTSFLDDFEAKVWFTYRSEFPTIARSEDPKALSAMSLSVRLRSQLGSHGGFTSDTGWGCMIRSGQSLLANSLLFLRLGRDWRRTNSDLAERQLLSMFADDSRAPFSIHRFVDHGAVACGKHPGEWFGPSATAQCIQALTNSIKPSELKVYVTGDGTDVYEDAFMDIAKPDGRFTPTLILVGTRLGVDSITPVYWEALKACLQMPQSIGIAGGRPSSSHYFIGVQGQYLFYLDPHQTRAAFPMHDDLAEYTKEELDSCHTRRLRRIHIKEMDPSMLLAFLIRSEDDWGRWKRAVREVQGKAVVQVADRTPTLHGLGVERDGAIDEVEAFDDTDDDETIIGT